MSTVEFNKDTVLELLGLLPTDSLEKAISDLEIRAIQTEKDTLSNLELAKKNVEGARKALKDIQDLKTQLIQVKNDNDIIIKDAIQSKIKTKRNVYIGGTFKDRIKSLFEDGIPKTSKTLWELHNIRFGTLKFKAVSAQLSPLVTTEKLYKFELIENAFGTTLNYYAPIHWFGEDGKMLEQYAEKIKRSDLFNDK